MENTDQLTARVHELTRQIGSLRTGLSTSELKRKIDRVKAHVRELREQNDQLHRDNRSLRAALTSLISSIEESELSGLVDSLEATNREFDAILAAKSSTSILSDLERRGRLSVVEQRAKQQNERDEASAMATKLLNPVEEEVDLSFEENPEKSDRNAASTLQPEK